MINKYKKKLTSMVAVLLILLGIGLVVWVGIYIMLYGGIMQSVNYYGIDTAKFVWGIIRALFFEVGFFAGILPIKIGIAIL